MSGWWRGRTNRERILLGMGLLATLSILLLTLWWQPLVRDAGALREAVSRQEQNLAWMEQAADRIRAASDAHSARPTGLPGGGSLVTTVDQTARSAGLGEALNQVDPQGADKVRVRLEGASFDALLGWVASLETESGIRVESAAIEPATGSGRVDARLVLHGAAP